MEYTYKISIELVLELEGSGKPAEQADEMLLGDGLAVPYERTLIWSHQRSEPLAVTKATVVQQTLPVSRCGPAGWVPAVRPSSRRVAARLSCGEEAWQAWAALASVSSRGVSPTRPDLSDNGCARKHTHTQSCSHTLSHAPTYSHMCIHSHTQ